MTHKPVVLKLTYLEELSFGFTGIVEWKHGTKHHYLNGLRHRFDGPAYENPKRGLKQWWYDGRFVFNNAFFALLEGNYIVVERGIPTDRMFGEVKLTMTKLLTAEGTMLVPDNLPGFEVLV
jgi:hypothetical protein